MSESAGGISTGMAAVPAHRTGGSGLLAALADLELEAEGLHLDERAAEAEELGTAEYAAVTLAARFLGSVGAQLHLRLTGGLEVRGRLVRAAEGWSVVEGTGTWLVPLGAVVTAGGLSARAVPEGARTVLARLTLASALRRLAAERTACVLHLREGGRLEGSIGRVGADFAEVTGPRGDQVVPLAAIAAIQEAW